MPPSAASKAPARAPGRAGEGAPAVAEQLGVQQGLGQRPAVDDHERPLGARRGIVQRPGDQLLAGAGLALDQHRRLAGGDLGQAGEQLAHGRAGPQQRAEAGLAPQRHRRRLRAVVDRQLDAAQLDVPAVGHAARLDPHALDEGAVAAAEIAHPQAARARDPARRAAARPSAPSPPGPRPRPTRSPSGSRSTAVRCPEASDPVQVRVLAQQHLLVPGGGVAEQRGLVEAHRPARLADPATCGLAVHSADGRSTAAPVFGAHPRVFVGVRSVASAARGLRNVRAWTATPTGTR